MQAALVQDHPHDASGVGRTGDHVGFQGFAVGGEPLAGAYGPGTFHGEGTLGLKDVGVEVEHLELFEGGHQDGAGGRFVDAAAFHADGAGLADDGVGPANLSLDC